MHRNRVNSKNNFKRRCVQFLSAVLLNCHVTGFINGTIFRGSTKRICVPVLNCHSCPGAAGACPVGSLQGVLSSGKKPFSFYVSGIIAFVGVMLGRLVCGFFCPFGFIQDLLFKVPVGKINTNNTADRVLRYFKYAVLFLTVLLMPLFVRDDLGFGQTWFCAYICPAGTLEAGIPLLLSNASLRNAAGILFCWKSFFLFCVIIASISISRPFCRYVCPLGAFYGLFSRFSLYTMSLDRSKCIKCGKCESICPMGVHCTEEINTSECIRCSECVSTCPVHAICAGFDTSSFVTAHRKETRKY